MIGLRTFCFIVKIKFQNVILKNYKVDILVNHRDMTIFDQFKSGKNT